MPKTATPCASCGASLFEIRRDSTGTVLHCVFCGQETVVPDTTCSAAGVGTALKPGVHAKVPGTRAKR